MLSAICTLEILLVMSTPQNVDPSTTSSSTILSRGKNVRPMLEPVVSVQSKNCFYQRGYLK